MNSVQVVAVVTVGVVITMLVTACYLKSIDEQERLRLKGLSNPDPCVNVDNPYNKLTVVGYAPGEYEINPRICSSVKSALRNESNGIQQSHIAACCEVRGLL